METHVVYFASFLYFKEGCKHVLMSFQKL